MPRTKLGIDVLRAKLDAMQNHIESLESSTLTAAEDVVADADARLAEFEKRTRSDRPLYTQATRDTALCRLKADAARAERCAMKTLQRASNCIDEAERALVKGSAACNGCRRGAVRWDLNAALRAVLAAARVLTQSRGCRVRTHSWNYRV